MKKRQYLAIVTHNIDEIGGIFVNVAISSSKPIDKDNAKQMEWVKKECEKSVTFSINKIFLIEV